MSGKKAYLIAQAILCILLVLLLSVEAIRIFQEGTARRAEQPLEAIYTPQAVAAAFARLAPLLYLSVGMTAAGLLLGVKEEQRSPKTQRKTEAMEKKKENPKKQTVLRVAFLIAALVFIALGALNGSLMDVLAKAINLCSECIGLG